jgi:hypothetical protein
MGEGRFDAAESAGQRDLHRVTVTDAARILGVTESAVRKRVQRGKIPHDKAEDGRVYVYLDPTESRALSGKVMDGHASQSRPISPGQSRDKDIQRLEERNAFLEDLVKRQMGIIADLVQRVPELEAAPEPPDEPGSAWEASEGAEPRSDTVGPQMGAQEPTDTVRRPWWLRWFGG